MNEEKSLDFHISDNNHIIKKSKTLDNDEKANETMDIANISNEISDNSIQANANLDLINDENAINSKVIKSKSCFQRRVTFDKLNVIEVESYKFYNLSNTISPNFDEYSNANKSTRFKMIECCCVIM